MRIKHWLLVLILSAPVIEADNSSFFYEHVFLDSALVMSNGVVISVVLGVVCWGTGAFPVNECVDLSQRFVPEATVFLYLEKSQWSKEAIYLWSSLNRAFFSGTMVYIMGFPGSQINGIWPAMTLVSLMNHQQVMRISANTAVRVLTGANQTALLFHALFNGVSTGLIAGGLSLWFMYQQTLNYQPFVSLAVSTGAALVSTLIYFSLAETGNISLLEKAVVVIVAGAGAGVIAIAVVVVGAAAAVGAAFAAVAGAGVEAEAEAVALALAAFAAGAEAESVVKAIVLAVASAEAKAIVLAVVGVGAGAGAGACTGAFIVVITGFMTSKLLQCSAGLTTIKYISRITALGLPLMMIAWLVSLEKFVAANVSAHETMQNEFMFSLNDLNAFYPGNWIVIFKPWEWFTD